MAVHHEIVQAVFMMYQTSFTTRRKVLPLLLILLVTSLSGTVSAANKPHVITFGKWVSAKWPNATGQELFDFKVRPLLVDARIKEYTTGNPHEVTDRLFVVRRAFRLNDALPFENAPRWQWQRGGWLLVDRLTGHISQLNLPEFDAFHSTASWYRDYIAYCGVSEDGKDVFAMLVQVGRRKPILKKEVGQAKSGDDPDSACLVPTWERSPMRVTFQADGDHKLIFSLRNRIVDGVNDGDDAEE